MASRLLRPCLFLIAALAVASHALATPVTVVVNTSALAGQSVDLAFDLTTSTANAATVNPFSSDITQFGGVTTTGNVSGSLTQLPLVLGGAPNFHEYLQTVTLGNTFMFTFVTTALPVDLQQFPPDNFALFVLIGGIPVDTGGPGGALITFDFGIQSPVLTLFSSDTLPVREGTPPSVPEPSALLLVMAALFALIAAVLRRPI